MASLKSRKMVRGKDRKWLGVCSAIGEYFEVDPVVVRVAWILLTVFTSFIPGFVAYLLMAWVIPEEK